MYAKNDCVFQYHMPETMHVHAQLEPRVPRLREDKGWRQKNDPVQLAIYSTPCRAFASPRKARAPAASRRCTCASASPPTSTRCPFWYAPLEEAATDLDAYPLNAITQRPMAMYHSWDSQNAWLRQIHSHNYLQVNPLTARAAGHRRTAAGAGSRANGARCAACCATARRSSPAPCGPGTRSARLDGAGGLAPGADEARKGFLLNQLISEEWPFDGRTISNSDPITGQAGWYDVRVRIRPAAPEVPERVFPEDRDGADRAGVRARSANVSDLLRGAQA
jgi:anaerobic selenocysteine-containing dehydrogenase